MKEEEAKLRKTKEDYAKFVTKKDQNKKR